MEWCVRAHSAIQENGFFYAQYTCVLQIAKHLQHVFLGGGESRLHLSADFDCVGLYEVNLLPVILPVEIKMKRHTKTVDILFSTLRLVRLATASVCP